MTCVQEHLPDRGARRHRVQHADAREHVVGRPHTGRPAGVQQPTHVVAGIGVAGHHDRDAHARARRAGPRCGATPRRRRRRCRRRAGSRPAAPRASSPIAAVVELAGRDVDDAGTGRQPDAVAGLGGHQRLVADDGQPQPPAGARTEADVASGPRRHARPRPRRVPRRVRPARRCRSWSDARPSPPAGPWPRRPRRPSCTSIPTSPQTTQRPYRRATEPRRPTPRRQESLRLGRAATMMSTVTRTVAAPRRCRSR